MGMKPRAKPVKVIADQDLFPIGEQVFWFVNVQYSVLEHDINEMDRSLESVVGAEHTGSGVHIGTHIRDVDWMFYTKEEAQNAFDALIDSGLSIEVFDIVRG